MYLQEKNKGFTLIELLVVIAIIGTLASVVLASLNTARGKARDAKRASDMHQVQSALQLYWLDNDGTYPPSQTDYLLPVESHALSPDYLPIMSSDPLYTGTDGYRYRRSNSKKSIHVASSS